ncbi:hypothetical protein [Nostoc sp. NMS8]|uniref:hypothetical protein n=1 Tax=Nostoc sp. NMS8 TaxID=2815392 RepID=UPI0025FE6838|nr:hypothetical protein [Nostoc sp. NMS8]MBN3957493.1 hypothetical protein [Nostoc sp. NMS8]
MSKPLGYYTAHTPGDGSYLELLEERYGATFEKITKKEKLFLVAAIADQLCAEQDGDPRIEIKQLPSEMYKNSLADSDLMGLLEALIAQIRWGQQHEPVVHHS